MERLDFSSSTAYDATEAAIHLNRYAFARPFCQGAKVLDAACGQGYGSYLMRTWGAREVVGIDIDEDAIKQANWLFKQDGLTYKQHTVEELPFEDHSFDLVVSFETIEHIDYPEKLLKEIKRVLKPGGTIIVSCPNDNYYYENGCSKNPFHKREYTFFEFKETLERNLGYRGEYYLAFALDGFVNIPFEKRTEPVQGVGEDALGMLHYEQCDSALCVPQQRLLNHWNANYYIGIWNGRGRQSRYSTVVTPRETFIDHKDKDYELLRHFDRMQKELNESKELNEVLSGVRDELAAKRDELAAGCSELLEKNLKLEAEFSLVRQEYASCQSELVALKRREEISKNQFVELERLRTLMELARSERDEARRHMHENWDHYQVTLGERDAVQEELNRYKMELERIKTLLDMTRRERDEVRRHMHENWENYQIAIYERNELKNRVDSIESSRGVKLLGKIYRLREKLKGLFRRV